MATGGGNSSHGSLSLSSSLLNTSSSDSLQTPDTSTLFVSSLSGLDGGPTLPSVEPDITSPQSFTSLEELLNVTGINSPNLGPGSGAGGGVYSLQQLAKQVDSGQQDSFDLQPPPKKPHLDPSVSQPQNLQQLPANIRIQPLTSVSLSADKPSVSLAPSLPNNKTELPSAAPPSSSSSSSTSLLPTTLSTLNTTTIPSLYPGTSSTTGLNLSSATVGSTLRTLGSATSGQTLISTLPATLNSAINSAVSSTLHVGSATSSRTALPAVSSTNPAVGPTLASTTTSGVNRNASQPTSTIIPQPAQPQIMPTSLPNPVNILNSQKHPSNRSDIPPFQSVSHPTPFPMSSTAPSAASATPSTTTLPNKTVGPTSASGQNPLLQLIMLYKNYQALGDEEGMARVKQQFIQHAAQTKIFSPPPPARPQASSQSDVPFQPTLVRTTGSSSQSSLNQSIGSRSLLIPTPPLAGQTSNLTQKQSSVSQPPTSQLQQGAINRLGPSQTVNLASTWTTSLASNTTHTQLPSTVSKPPTQGSSTINPLGQGSSTINPLGQGSSTTTPPILLGQSSSGLPAMEQANIAMATQQRLIKQLQSFVATLPESQRPKNINELRELIKKYGSVLSLGGGNKAGPQPSVTAATNLTDFSSLSSSQDKSRTVPSLLGSIKTEASHSSAGITTHPLTTMATSTSIAPSLSTSSASSVINSTSFGTASAQVAEHFKTSLLGMQPPPPRSVSTLPNLPAQLPFTSSMPIVIGDSPPGQGKPPQSGATPLTVHAPVTSQFQQTTPSNTEANKMPTAKVPTNPQGIQPGVPTPLPPGLTLETLNVLCRLPESDLVKLKIPAPLLSAIRVWKARQTPLNKTSAKQPSASTSRSNIPVLTAPPSSNSTSSSSGSSSIVTFRANGNVFGQNLKVGDALKASGTSLTSSVMKTSVDTSTSKLGQTQPLVIPNSSGFPPRSLHAYIPMVPQAQQQLRNTTAMSSTGGRNVAQPMTRFRSKMEQQKVESERLQAITRALQTSEEARIAFRFSAHLEKMHSQLLSPDITTPFKSHHDVLARLLPYHIYSEPEPPHAAVEKADAVFESVAQVLLSRSRGLMSRFQQIITKTEAQGGTEQLGMQLQLERLFQEGEQERIKQENIEKQQAEQVAADLSLMADGMDTFDPDFSLGDAFFPVVEMDAGIT